jgi:hypothetical protein
LSCSAVTCVGVVISKPMGTPLSTTSTNIPGAAAIVRALFTPVARGKYRYATG